MNSADFSDNCQPIAMKVYTLFSCHAVFQKLGYLTYNDIPRRG